MSYTRREFLKATLGASAMLSLASPAPNLLVRAATAGTAQRDDRDTVLVVVQLSGGNDGFSLVFTGIIFVVSVALFLYARAMAAKGVLR